MPVQMMMTFLVTADQKLDPRQRNLRPIKFHLDVMNYQAENLVFAAAMGIPWNKASEKD